jgi:uncharacterized membrane protein YbjE (DUF340 family)
MESTPPRYLRNTNNCYAMLTVVIIMSVGIAIGYGIRNRKFFVAIADRLTMWAIYLLLFLLGVAIGANEVIVKNLPNLGITALAVALGGVIGSVSVAWVGYRVWFKSKGGYNEE